MVKYVNYVLLAVLMMILSLSSVCAADGDINDNLTSTSDINELITVFGDLIAYSLIHGIILTEFISLIHEITQAILQVSQQDQQYTHYHQHLTVLLSNHFLIH